ncbi:MAG TPA: hypothetical protein VN673_10195, partial [Clostridia bacterium]|nr:hypothetical protein [Clostridia bacterium]
AMGNKQTLLVIGPDGKFDFESRMQGGRVVVADESGWADVEAGPGDDHLKLRLRPWSVVKGVLVTTNGTPAAGMVLALMWTKATSDGKSFQELGRTTTDSQGAFEFQNVPPRRLELQRVAPQGTVPRLRSQTWLVPLPGVTNDLGRVVCDPPPGVLDSLKKTLGL